MPEPVRPGWGLCENSGLEYYESRPAEGLALVFTTRRGGVSTGGYESLNLSLDAGDAPKAVGENYSRLRRGLGLPPLVTLKQVHSDKVLPVNYELTPPDLLEGDACYTCRPGIALAVKVADCLAVYVFSKDGTCAGIAHCGWRGSATRIAEKLARQMAKRCSVPLVDLRFSLGPCVCPDCYVVGEDVRDRFREDFPAAERFFKPAPGSGRGSRFRLDIRAANRWLLSEMGLTASPSLDMCSSENPGRFYSVRRDKTTGRNLGIIILR